MYCAGWEEIRDIDKVNGCYSPGLGECGIDIESVRFSFAPSRAI